MLSFIQLLYAETKLQSGTTRVPEFTVSCGASEMLTNWLRAERWHDIQEQLVREALRLVAAGAEALVFPDLALIPIAAEVGRAVQLPIISPRAGLTAMVQTRRLQRLVVIGAHSASEENFWRETLQGPVIGFPSKRESKWLRERANASSLPDGTDESEDVERLLANWGRDGSTAAVVLDPALTGLFRCVETAMTVLHASEVQVWAAAAWLTGKTQRYVEV